MATCYDSLPHLFLADHWSFAWFTVAVSAADSVGTETDRSWAIRAKRYIENSKNSEKITTNLKKCRHQYSCITCPRHQIAHET